MTTSTERANERLRHDKNATRRANYDFMHLASRISRVIAWLLVGLGGLLLVANLIALFEAFSFAGLLQALLVALAYGAGAVLLLALTEVFEWMEAQDYNTRKLIRLLEAGLHA